MALVKTNLNLFWYSCALSEVAQCIAVIEQAHIGCTTWISACMRWLDKNSTIFYLQTFAHEWKALFLL